MNEVLFFLNFSHYWHLQINKIFSPSSLDALLVAGGELTFGGRGGNKNLVEGESNGAVIFLGGGNWLLGWTPHSTPHPQQGKPSMYIYINIHKYICI